jgi:hypothetical protein
LIGRSDPLRRRIKDGFFESVGPRSPNAPGREIFRSSREERSKTRELIATRRAGMIYRALLAQRGRARQSPGAGQ